MFCYSLVKLCLTKSIPKTARFVIGLAKLCLTKRILSRIYNM